MAGEEGGEGEMTEEGGEGEGTGEEGGEGRGRKGGTQGETEQCEDNGCGKEKIQNVIQNHLCSNVCHL